MCVCAQRTRFFADDVASSRSLKTANGEKGAGGGACIKIAPATMTLTDGPPESDDDRSAAREAFKLYYTEYFFIFFSPFLFFTLTSFSPDGLPSSLPHYHPVRFSHTPTLARPAPYSSSSHSCLLVLQFFGYYYIFYLTLA